MREKTAGELTEEIVQYIQANYDDKKYGFLIVVATKVKQVVDFYQKSNMTSILRDYHLEALNKLGMHIQVESDIVKNKDDQEFSKETIR